MGLNDQQLQLSPLSGSLFALKTTSRGLSEPYFIQIPPQVVKEYPVD